MFEEGNFTTVLCLIFKLITAKILFFVFHLCEIHLSCKSQLDLQKFQAWRKTPELSSRGNGVRKNYIIETLRESSKRASVRQQTFQNKKLKVNLEIPKECTESNKWEPVCFKGFTKLFALSTKTLSAYKGIVEQGNIAVESQDHESLSAKGEGRRQNTLLWMKDLFHLLCDIMPSPDMSKKDYHLPKCSSKDGIYEEYVLEFLELHAKNDFCGSIEFKPYSKERFEALWLEHFPYVTVPVAMAFSVCDACANLHDKILSATKSKDKLMLLELKKIRREHLKFISEERMMYREHQRLAREEPDKYVCICIDGMDQSKLRSPHFAGRGIPKSASQ